MTGLLLLGATMAALAIFGKKGVSGVGRVDNEWGAHEMIVEVLNTRPLYDRYKQLVYDYYNSLSNVWKNPDKYDQEELRKFGIEHVQAELAKDCKRGTFWFSPGMGRNEYARKIAAVHIFDSFSEDFFSDLND